MGKSLASLFSVMGGGDKNRSKKISKLKTLLSLSIARLSLLKNHHQARCNHAHSDVADLLRLGHSDRALLRSEIIAKEENMLDVFALIQSYCHLISERSLLLQRQQKECPHELREAVSSLIYASSRSGEMPELQHVCSMFSALFGREFVSAATELRNSCGVNPKIVQKLSTRQPSLESRMRIIKEIATEKGIALDLISDDDPLAANWPEISKVDMNMSTNKNRNNLVVADILSGRSIKHNYKDVTTAAQAACEKAEDAAAAARAAVELSRSTHSDDDDNSDKKNKEESIFAKRNTHPAQYCYTSDSENDDEEEEEEEEAVFCSDKNISSGFSSTEKKLNKFGTWASKTNTRKNSLLFDDKSGSDSESEKNTKFREISDRTGLLDSTGDEKFEKLYCYEIASPQSTETAGDDCAKKYVVEQAKVTRRAISVRTRR